MDPNATLMDLLSAFYDLHLDQEDAGARRNAVEALNSLSDWLRKGGFSPVVTAEILDSINYQKRS